MLLRRVARFITETALVRTVLVRKRIFIGMAGLAAIALAGVALWAWRKPPPTAPYPTFTTESATLHRRLADAEAALQLSFVRAAVAAESGRSYAAYAALIERLADRLERLHTRDPGEVPWSELEPRFTQLAIQLANGDPLAETTLDELIILLRQDEAQR